MILSHINTICSVKTISAFSGRAIRRMAGSSWSYETQEAWKNIPGCQANGNRQSPINIADADVKQEASLSPIQLSAHWYNDLNGSLVNTGTSLMFKPSEDPSPLSVQTSSGSYIFQQFHFHWGSCTGKGSEHTVNGISQDSELHFVLKNEDDQKPNDFAVLGVLLKSNDTQPVTGAWNLLSSPPKYNQTVDIVKFPISQLLPSSFSYWYYFGSLTTPPCSEVVNWHVLQEVVAVPTSVLKQWRRLERDDSGAPLPSNHRSVQMLNGRKIYSYIQ